MERTNYRMATDRKKCCNTCNRMHHLDTDGWAVCNAVKRGGFAEHVFKYDVCDEYCEIKPRC